MPNYQLNAFWIMAFRLSCTGIAVLMCSALSVNYKAVPHQCHLVVRTTIPNVQDRTGSNEVHAATVVEHTYGNRASAAAPHVFLTASMRSVELHTAHKCTMRQLDLTSLEMSLQTQSCKPFGQLVFDALDHK